MLRAALPRTDPLKAKDRNARGQGQESRTQAQSVLQIKKDLKKIFSGVLKQKEVFKNLFQAFSKGQI